MAQISDEAYRYLQELSAQEMPRVVFDVELARALLKRIEWSSVDEGGYSRCPGCLGLDPSDPGIAHWPMGAAPVGSQWKGHRPACELAALIGPTRCGSRRPP